MTCEVCDREGCPTLAPGRRFCSRAAEDCAAHAVNWRDLAIAGRTREAALTAEVERLATTKADDEQRAANALMVLTVDLGLPMPLADETWVAFAERIRGAVAAVKSDLAAARADAANARQIATEACDGWSAAERAHADTVEGEGYEFDRAGAEKPIAALRASARLARTRRRWRHRVVSCAENTDPPTRQHDSEVPVTIPTDLLARLRAAIADAKDDGHAYAVATRADLAALLALVEAPAPLTVGAALADPRVQDGSHVAEYSGEHDVAEYRQTRVDAGGFRIWSRWRLADRWGPWRDNGNTALDGCDVRKPCRLVPLADADCDPNERGPL